jgi:hypothetical protein
MVSRKTSSLPDKIYLINSAGHYYSLDKGAVTLNKTFPDKSCEVTVEYLDSNPDEFYLRTCDGGYFQYHRQKKKDSHIDHKPTKKFPKNPIPFSLLDLDEKDTFVFRSSKGKFMTLDVNAKNRIELGGFAHAKIRVGDPALKKLITNFAYNLELSTISDLTPEIAVKTTLRNDSLSDSTQALTYNYLVSHLGSWKNQIGASLSPKSIGAKIPSLVDGAIVLAENYSHVELLSKAETKTATSSVSVPARTRGVATVLIYKAVIQVPFTYTEAVWYQSGGFEERFKSGAYSNTVTYGVDVEITDLISINTHTGTEPVVLPLVV